MRFATLAIVALISSVQAVELHNQVHAKGLKAPHPVRQLAQQKSKSDGKWRMPTADEISAARSAVGVS